MIRQEIFPRMAAVLTTMLECEEANLPFPRSAIYVMCDYNISDSELTKEILVKTKLVYVTSETLTLTPLGVEKAKELNEKILNKK